MTAVQMRNEVRLLSKPQWFHTYQGEERGKELSKSALEDASSQGDRAQEITEVPSTAMGDAPGLDHAPVLAGLARGDGAEYCKICALWLNGRAQMEDHKIGRKHRRNARA